MPDSSWTAELSIDGVRAATATLEVTDLTGDFDPSETSVRSITSGGLPLARVALRDPVNGNGNEPVSSGVVRLAVSDVAPGFVLNGISLTSSSAVFAPEKLNQVMFDGEGTTVVDAATSLNLIAGGVGAVPEPLALNGVVNFNEPGAWDNPNGFTSDAHSLKWSVDAAGSSFLSVKFTTEAPPALFRRTAGLRRRLDRAARYRADHIRTVGRDHGDRLR